MAGSTSDPPPSGRAAGNRQVIKIRRTLRGLPFSLAEGELSVEMAYPGRAVRAWVGVPESVDESGRKLLAAGYATVGETLPENPGLGEMHWDKTTAKLFLFDGERWVIAVNTPGGVGGWGVTDGSEAAPGEVGEFITANGSVNNSGAEWNTLSPSTIGQVTLPAGDWNVQVMFYFHISNDGLTGIIRAGCTNNPPGMQSNNLRTSVGFPTEFNLFGYPLRVSVASEFTIYLIVDWELTGAGATVNVGWDLQATRVR